MRKVGRVSNMRQINDENSSTDLNKSRDEMSNRIKTAFAELELFRQRNQILEDCLKKSGIEPPNENKKGTADNIINVEAPVKNRLQEFKHWAEIQVLILFILRN